MDMDKFKEPITCTGIRKIWNMVKLMWALDI